MSILSNNRTIYPFYKSTNLILNYILDQTGQKVWLAITTSESEIFYRPVTLTEAIELGKKHQVPDNLLQQIKG